MPTDTEILAAAAVIFQNDESCGYGSDRPFAPCVPGDDCLCVQTARQALEAAEKIREPVVFVMDLYQKALARALGRPEADAGVAGEPMMAAVAHSQRVAHLETEIERLRARLDMIADIAEGSGTVNSLPHIAKIARGVDEQ